MILRRKSGYLMPAMGGVSGGVSDSAFAADFGGAGSGYLTHAVDPFLAGAIDGTGYWRACWAYFDTLTTVYIASCTSSGTGWDLSFLPGNKLMFRTNLQTSQGAALTAALSTGTWYFIYCHVAATSGNRYLAVYKTDGTLFEEVTNSAAATLATPTNAFGLNYVSQSSVTGQVDGAIDAFVGGNGNLTAGEIGELLNTGAGRAVADLPASVAAKAAFGWDLEESGGTRADAIGSLDLTATGTTGRRIGHAPAPP